MLEAEIIVVWWRGLRGHVVFVSWIRVRRRGVLEVLISTILDLKMAP